MWKSRQPFFDLHECGAPVEERVVTGSVDPFRSGRRQPVMGPLANTILADPTLEAAPTPDQLLVGNLQELLGPHQEMNAFGSESLAHFSLVRRKLGTGDSPSGVQGVLTRLDQAEKQPATCSLLQ